MSLNNGQLPSGSTSTPLRALEEALLSFASCTVVISRSLVLDRIATHALAFASDSQVTWFEGNVEAYEKHRRALLGDEATAPTASPTRS